MVHPFRKPDATSEYSRSAAQHVGSEVQMVIVTVDRIAGNITLQEKNDRQYFLKSDIIGHAFAMFEWNLRDCLPSVNSR